MSRQTNERTADADEAEQSRETFSLEPDDMLPILSDQNFQALFQASEERAKRETELETREKLKKQLRLQFSNDAKLDDDDDDDSPAGWKGTLYKVVQSTQFDMVMGCVIIVNSALIGLESTYDIQNRDTSIFRAMEHVFLLIYSAELAARFYVYGLKCLKNSWVAFDFSLVAIGVLAAYVLGPVFSYLESEGSDSLGVLLVLRTFRLFRLARTLRLFAQFKVLWMLVRGLLSSARTMTYVFVLMFLIFYVFACISMELITKPQFQMTDAERAENPEYDTIVMTFWSTIPVTMMTLMMFATVDSVGGIYLPMVNHRPLLIVYFVAFMMLVSICLMNLVTAVIVESSLAQAGCGHLAQQK